MQQDRAEYQGEKVGEIENFTFTLMLSYERRLTCERQFYRGR